MFSLFKAVCIFLVSLSFPPRSFPLLTLPKYAAAPNALIRYLTRRDVCNYRQSLNYGPSAFDLILRHQKHKKSCRIYWNQSWWCRSCHHMQQQDIKTISKQLNIDRLLPRAADLLKIRAPQMISFLCWCKYFFPQHFHQPQQYVGDG